MPKIWNVPTQFTQGDRITWTTYLDDYNPITDTLSCFIRGRASLDLTGTPQPNVGGWEFEITTARSNTLNPGKYKTQFVVFELGINRATLGTTELIVLPSFEGLTELEVRSADEIELERITEAIAKLVSGAVSEYEIGDRRMRYQDLDKLTYRQEYLRRRIAIVNGKVSPGGRNVGVSFNG